MAKKRRWRPYALLLVGLLALAVRPAARYWHAAEFLSALASLGKSGRAASDPLVLSEDVSIAGERGPIRARLYYRADRARGPGLVVAHGVHYQGIDERRLVPFARGLAREGLVVLTPELAELADYRITDSGVGVLKDAARYLAARRDRVSDERVGLLGFSFAGGLALVASELPELRDRLSFVASVGGHQDLSRVLHFLIRNEIATPAGVEHEQAHEYGLVVLVYDNLERFVPPADLPALRGAFKAWLEEDRPRARALASLRTTAEAERLWQLLEEGRLQTLAPELEALLAGQSAALSALSPRDHLREIGVPVYLLHGAHDSVIPPSETDWGDRELGSVPHSALVSPLLEHVELSKASGLREELALLAFMARLF
jgi:pimeloyl-ACP methyl ester carboxylesterase